MTHIRIPFTDEVLHWYLAALSAEAFATGDPELLARLEQGTRLVAEGLARARQRAGLPPVGRHDPHEGHHVGKDAAGVDVCWSCIAEHEEGP